MKEIKSNLIVLSLRLFGPIKALFIEVPVP